MIRTNADGELLTGCSEHASDDCDAGQVVPDSTLIERGIEGREGGSKKRAGFDGRFDGNAAQQTSLAQVAALVHQYDRVELLVRMVQGVSV